MSQGEDLFFCFGGQAEVFLAGISARSRRFSQQIRFCFVCVRVALCVLSCVCVVVWSSSVALGLLRCVR